MPCAENSTRGMPRMAAKSEAISDRVTELGPRSGVYHFGTFEADFSAGELRRSGIRIRIQDQPLQVLSILLARPGEVITREDFRALLWPDHTFVDFDHGLNSAIRKLRHALDDDPDTPRFVETIPRHGYRFIGSAPAGPLPARAEPRLVAERSDIAGEIAGDFFPERSQSGRPMVNGHFIERRKSRRHGRTWFVAVISGILLLLAGLAAGINWAERRAVRPPIQPTMMLAVIPLNYVGQDPSEGFIAEGMTEELITQLGKVEPAQFGVIAHTSVEQYKHTAKPIAVIGKELGVDYVLEGSAQVMGNRVRVAVQLIKVSDQSHLWAQSYDSNVDEMLEAQAKVAADVVQAIHVKLNRQPAGAGPATKQP